jgi:hypothetical protein
MLERDCQPVVYSVMVGNLFKRALLTRLGPLTIGRMQKRQAIILLISNRSRNARIHATGYQADG